MNEDLLKICNNLVGVGEKLGADQVEVFGITQKSIDANIENNELKILTRGEGSGVGVRVFRSQSLGFASTNSLETNSIEDAVRRAIALSKKAPPDLHNGLPDPKKFGFVPGLYDEAIVGMTESDVIDRTMRMLNAAKGIDERVTVDSGRFTALMGTKAISNSLGIEGSERFTAISFDIGAHAVEGGNVTSLDFRFDGARMLREDTSEEMSVDLAESVVNSLSTKKVESYVGHAILSPMAAIDLIVSPILFCVDSNNVQKGMSRFAGKHGEQIAAPAISINDDGTLPSGLSSSVFDREGVPHKTIEIMDDGRLKNFLHDQYTATKEGTESTGHASGGIRGVPMIDSTNIMVKPGNRSLENMVASVNTGLLIHRFSGNIDPVSGDFSGLAKGSRSIAHGSFEGVVRETMISGNVYDLLRKLIEASSETKKIMDFRVPHLLVDGISVTGG